MAGDDTSSPPKATTVPPEENAAKPPLFPFGMRTPAATYASSISTNMSAYEDLPGHHLLSVRNLIASTLDSSYPDSADERYVFVGEHVAQEWVYSGVCDREAFLSFQAAADYCLTCSDDSSDGDYDPTRECFIVELEEHDDDAPNDTGNPPAAPPVVPAAPRLATSANSGMRQAQLEQLRELEAKLQEERKQRQ